MNDELKTLKASMDAAKIAYYAAKVADKADKRVTNIKIIVKGGVVLNVISDIENKNLKVSVIDLDIDHEENSHLLTIHHTLIEIGNEIDFETLCVDKYNLK